MRHWQISNMKLKNYKLITILLLAVLLLNAGAVLAREKEIEIGDDNLAKVEVSALASFQAAMSDFKRAKEDFLKSGQGFAPDTGIFQKLEIQLPQAAPVLAEPKAVKLVEKATEVLIERNKEILEQVEKQKEIYLEKDKIIVPAVNNEIKKLEALKNEIKTNTKPGTVKSVTEQLKLVRFKQIEVKKAIIIPHLAGFEMGPLKVAEMRKDKTAASLDELRGQGKDTNALEAKIKEAEDKLTLIKSDLNQLKTDVLKTTLKTELTRLRDEIKLVYQIFEEVAILAKSL